MSIFVCFVWTFRACSKEGGTSRGDFLCSADQRECGRPALRVDLGWERVLGPKQDKHKVQNFDRLEGKDSEALDMMFPFVGTLVNRAMPNSVITL